MGGFRPVVEMQFDAFAYPAFEQVVSHVAKLRNRTRGVLSAPLVIRMPYAGGIGGVEHHCDSSEAYYVHTPGLKVVTPATVSDAYGLLRQSIAYADPVVFLEPKLRYWSKERRRTAEARRSDSPVLRSGADVTLVAYGPSVGPRCRPRRRRPRRAGGRGRRLALDRAVRRCDGDGFGAQTGRGVVVQEAPGFGGWGRGRRT